MNAFTIKDLENLTGIKAHTIRIWEQRYTFLRPQRTDTNIRYYNNDELKKILNISLLNKYGFKISHIDKMSEEDIRNKILSINDVHAQQERIVNWLIQGMIDMDLEGFERVLEEQIRAKGIEKQSTKLFSLSWKGLGYFGLQVISIQPRNTWFPISSGKNSSWARRLLALCSN